jgi:hypothetical protein
MFIIITGVIIKESKPVIHHKVQKGTFSEKEYLGEYISLIGGFMEV